MESTHSKPTISVIIPLYNHAQYLSDAVKSVVNQSPPVQEIILINDASTDNSQDEARRLMEEYGGRLKLATLAENIGIGGVRRLGSELARGDIVCFLSSDDYWMPGLVKTMLDNFIDLDTIMYTGWMAKRGNEVTQSVEMCYGAESMKDGYWATIINFSAVWIPKKVFEKVRFDHELRMAEDLLFERQALESGFKMKSIPGIYCVRRVHPGQPGSSELSPYLQLAIRKLHEWRSSKG